MSARTIRDIFCLNLKTCLRLTSDSFLANALFCFAPLQDFEMEVEYHLLLGEGFVEGIDEIFAAEGVDAEAVPGTLDSETLGGTDEAPVSTGAVEARQPTVDRR